MTIAACIATSSTNETVAVWSVNVGDRVDIRDSRLTGAWVIPTSELRSLHFWESELVTLWAPSNEDFCAGAGPNTRCTTLEAIASNIRAEIARLDELFEAEVARRPKSSKLLHPRWPRSLQPTASPSTQHRGNSEQFEREALKLAKDLSRLTDAWFELEQERLSRPFLHESHGNPRPLPI